MLQSLKEKLGAHVFGHAELSAAYMLEEGEWKRCHETAHWVVFSKSALHNYAMRLLEESESVSSVIKFGVWKDMVLEPLRDDFVSFRHRGQVWGLEFASAEQGKEFFRSFEAHKGESKNADESEVAQLRFNFGEGADQKFDNRGADLARQELERMETQIEELRAPTGEEVSTAVKTGAVKAGEAVKVGAVKAKAVYEEKIKPRLAEALDKDEQDAAEGKEEDGEEPDALRKSAEHFELPSSGAAIELLRQGGVKAKHLYTDSIRPRVRHVLQDAHHADDVAEEDAEFKKKLHKTRPKAKRVPPRGDAEVRAALAASEKKLIAARRQLAWERSRRQQFRQLLVDNNIAIPPPKPVGVPTRPARREATAAALRVAVHATHEDDDDSWGE